MIADSLRSESAAEQCGNTVTVDSPRSESAAEQCKNTVTVDSPRSKSAAVWCKNTVTVQNLLSPLEVGETSPLHGYLQMNLTPKKSPREEQTTPKNSNYMSNIMRKSVFCICKNRGANQLCGYPTKSLQSNSINPNHYK